MASTHEKSIKSTTTTTNLTFKLSKGDGGESAQNAIKQAGVGGSLFQTILGNYTSRGTLEADGDTSFDDVFRLVSNEENASKNALIKGSDSSMTLEKTLSDQMDNLRVRFQTLNYLMKLFFAQRVSGMSVDYNQRLSDYVSAMDSGNYMLSSTTSTYRETEAMSFSTTGTVQTADGREISFNMEVGMSRSFYEEYASEYISKVNPLLDPLVIQLEGSPRTVSDQKFYFDLDCDGEEEEISTLTAGNGFLALDKNGDGIINDGSELFGALSGNGFTDLSEYDLDENGWIDEADEIFQKLRIWAVDESGNRTLYTLKEVGVGAICLKNQGTEYSMTNDNNEVQGQLRRSGFFLRENGSMGMMQQVDLAVG